MAPELGKPNSAMIQDATTGGPPEGDAPEGDAPEGDAPEGDAPEGDAPEGDNRVGATAPDTGRHLEQTPRRVVRGREFQERTSELFSRLEAATAEQRRQIRDQVVTGHLWLADSAARRYGPRHHHEDLVQVARVGLVEAFDRYDPARAVPYSHFAGVTVHGLLRRYLRDHGWAIRPPRSIQEAANTVRSLVPMLTQELGRTPTTTDVAACLGWTPDVVDTTRTAELGLQSASIESLVGDAWVPQQPPEWDIAETRILLHRAAQALSEQDRGLLRMRFRDEMTQVQIAAATGTNQMQVSRRLARLMAKLRLEIGDLDNDLPT